MFHLLILGALSSLALASNHTEDVNVHYHAHVPSGWHPPGVEDCKEDSPGNGYFYIRHTSRVGGKTDWDGAVMGCRQQQDFCMPFRFAEDLMGKVSEEEAWKAKLAHLHFDGSAMREGEKGHGDEGKKKEEEEKKKKEQEEKKKKEEEEKKKKEEEEKKKQPPSYGGEDKKKDEHKDKEPQKYGGGGQPQHYAASENTGFTVMYKRDNSTSSELQKAAQGHRVLKFYRECGCKGRAETLREGRSRDFKHPEWFCSFKVQSTKKECAADKKNKKWEKAAKKEEKRLWGEYLKDSKEKKYECEKLS